MHAKGDQVPLITVVGKSGSGKTTFLEKLIAELKRRNYKIATIKHHSHAGFSIDKPGKDSWRHAQAGSDHVVIAAPDKIASYRLLERELTLDEISAGIADVDIILTEGFRSAQKPSLEIMRSATGHELLSKLDNLIAVASDVPIQLDAPQFNLEDAAGVADLIELKFLKPA